MIVFFSRKYSVLAPLTRVGKTQALEKKIFLHISLNVPPTLIIHILSCMVCVISEYHTYQIFTQAIFSHIFTLCVLTLSSRIGEMD